MSSLRPRADFLVVATLVTITAFGCGSSDDDTGLPGSNPLCAEAVRSIGAARTASNAPVRGGFSRAADGECEGPSNGVQTCTARVEDGGDCTVLFGLFTENCRHRGMCVNQTCTAAYDCTP